MGNYLSIKFSTSIGIEKGIVSDLKFGILMHFRQCACTKEVQEKGSDTKNQSYHQPIKIKFCMIHYSYQSIPDAKFESCRFSIFGDTTSQNFPLKKGTSHQIRVLTPQKMEFTLKHEFFVQNRYLRPKIDPHVNFSNFQE